ncbi:MAG: toprim domain-containing protein [Methylibium sp.]|nr:toprim domain-containing protein [Methylibium sp.]
MLRDPIEQFGAALAARGIIVKGDVVADGTIHRCDTEGRGGKGDGAYLLHLDGTPAGGFENWGDGIGWENWRANVERNPTVAERLALARHIEATTRERDQQQRLQWAEKHRRNADLWGRTHRATAGDPLARYLQRRIGIEAHDIPACLRLHPGLIYVNCGDKLGAYPAMVAPLTAPDGRTVALHRTYLSSDGHKANVPTVKKLTAASGPLAGACIRLHSPKGGVIGIAEGIETALAASMGSGVPTVAAYCAGALAGYCWPTGVQSLVIFADADKAGREAADKLLGRARRAGLHVDIMVPTEAGTDWCDVWAQRSAVEIEGDAA